MQTPSLPSLDALIAEQNQPGAPRAPVAGIYIYSQDERTTGFVKKVLDCGDPARNRYFSRLGDAIMEALDVPPQILVLDVHATDPLLHAHLERVRTTAECRGVAIVVRTHALAETDILSFISLEVNHIALALNPTAAVIKEIEQLLATPKRRARISNVVAVLGTRIGARLLAETESAMPDALLNRFQRHYGFTLRTHDVPQLRGSTTWGFIPVSNDSVALFVVHVAANTLSARRQAKRANALLTSHGFDTAAPAAAIGHLRHHLAPYLLPDEQVQASYLTYNRASGQARFYGTLGALCLADSGRPTAVSATGAAISAQAAPETAEAPLRLNSGGSLILPIHAAATGLLGGGNTGPDGLRRDAAWLAIDFAPSSVQTGPAHSGAVNATA